MRYAVALACFALIVARAIWPDLRFDAISLALLVVAAAALLVREWQELVGRIKKVKVGEVEVEFAEKLKDLANKTQSLETSLLEDKRIAVVREPPGGDIPHWMAMAGSDPRASLLLIGIEIEKTVRDIAAAAEMQLPSRPYPLSTQLAALGERELIDPRVVPLFTEFWAIRNAVVHGQHFEISEGKLYELVELGARILRMLRLKPCDRSTGSDNSDRGANFINPWEIEIPKISRDKD